MTTKDAYVNDDNFDPKEALKAAIEKRQFLIKSVFSDTRPADTD